LAEEEAGEVEGVVDTTSRLIGDDISEPAEILTDELINRGEGKCVISSQFNSTHLKFYPKQRAELYAHFLYTSSH